MRVAIINPLWIRDGNSTGIRSGSRWPHLRTDFFKTFPFPFQLAYASSTLRKAGHDVRVCDCIAEGIDDARLFGMLADFEPQIVFHETTTPTHARDKQWVRSIKERFGCIVVSGGQLATSFPESVLDVADFAIAGESEIALRTLVQALSENADYRAVPGLAFREGERVRRNPPELIADLDALPWPDRTFAPLKRYQETFSLHHPDATMISSRGCPFRCTFCLESYVFNHKANYRTRNVKDVVDEMAYLHSAFGVREIYFDDTSFTTNRNRVAQMCQEIIDRNLKIHWSCMGDARIDRESLALMRRSGCTGMKIGVETTNPKSLDAVHKPIATEHVVRCVENCRQLGIFIHGTFIIGLPEETEESVDATIAFAFRTPFDWMQFSPAIPYPGTPFYQTARENGWLVSDDWETATRRQNVNVSYPNLSAAVIAAKLGTCQRLLNRRVFSRPRLALKYLRLALYLKDVSILRMIVQRFVSVFK